MLFLNPVNLSHCHGNMKLWKLWNYSKGSLNKATLPPRTIRFINKHQSGFRRDKCTDDHLFRRSQSIIESFNRGEHVVAAFVDVEKAFDNAWLNGLRYRIFLLDLPTKMTHWLSDFLVGRVKQINVNGFLPNQINTKAEGSTGFCPKSITILDLRQRPSNTAPQTKLTISIYILHQNVCTRTF